MRNRNGREEFDIDFMANRLKMWSNVGHKIVLVLGSQTGGLYRSEELYSSLLQLTSDPRLGDSSQTQMKKFGVCHQILSSSSNWGLVERDQFIKRQLKDLEIDVEDLAMARLIVELKLVDTIITTCLDSLLEQALEKAGWKETDFDVYLPPPSQMYDPFSHPRLPCRIIKVFGQLATTYTFPQAGYIEQRTILSQQLKQHLQRDCLVIGLDPVWDAELYSLFPIPGDAPANAPSNAIWFINQESLDENSRLAQLSIQNERNVHLYCGNRGSYRNFTQNLHWHIFNHIPINPNDPTILLMMDKHIPQKMQHLASGLQEQQRYHLQKELRALFEGFEARMQELQGSFISKFEQLEAEMREQQKALISQIEHLEGELRNMRRKDESA